MPASAAAVVPPEPVAATPAAVYTPAALAAEIPPPSPLPKVAEPNVSAKAASTAVPTAPGFYINVGLFAVSTNGNNAVGILRGAGLPVFADTVESSKKGTLTRVRVGPYAKRVDAASGCQEDPRPQA